MATIVISPNMDLPVPVVVQDPGPDWANNVNACLSIIDQHNHSSGSGVQITPSGLNINADLTFNTNNAINLRSTRFTPQTAPLSIVTDIGCLYETGVDLWFNDGSGNQIQITKSGAVNATSSGISNGTATASFVSGVLVVNAATNTPANIQGASILLGNNVAASNYLTLEPPNAMGSSYTITLPQPNTTGNTQILTYDTTNTMGFSTGGVNPPGTIIMFGGVNAPTGYVICDGTSYLISAYPNLAAALFDSSTSTYAYGTADGTHFNVPDMRGMFPRGIDNGAGNDPDSGSRGAANTGGNTGDNVGSTQGWQVQSHQHYINRDDTAGSSNPLMFIARGNGNHLYDAYTDAAGGNQTNPINVYVTFCIKI